MMQRLRDEERTNAVGEHAARLVRAAAPLDVAPALRARVWRRVVATPPRGALARVPWLECASVLLLAAVAATAVVGWGLLRARGQAPFAASGGSPPALTPRPISPRPAGPVPAAPAPSPPPARDDAGRPGPEPTPHPAPRPTLEPLEPPVESAPAPATPPTGAPVAPRAAEPDSALVLQAVRALRHEHDTYRASSRLYTYLCLHPDGPLAEEALGLAIEAAAARRDEHVVPLADAYLARFPAGRYAAAAARARGRFAELARTRGVLGWRIPCGGAP